MDSNNIKMDYVDREGIQRRVLLPEGDHNVQEGIPLSLMVDSLYSHCPVEYRVRITDELWARGLIEPCDFIKPGASELIRSAILAAVKSDVLDIITLATKECTRDGRR